MSSNRLVCAYAFLASMSLFSSCDRINGELSEKKSDRFELKQDDHGRLIRLDKVTGDMAIVEGTHLVPLSARGGLRPGEPPAAKVPKSPESPQRGAIKSEDYGEFSSETDDEAITTTANAPVFATPDRKGQPVVVAAKGSTFRVLGTRFDEYHIEFNDSRLGHRVGYIEKKYAETHSLKGSAMQPVDVSSTDTTPNPTQPANAIPHDTKSLQPADVSVK
jgi:hypothetical protein